MTAPADTPAVLQVPVLLTVTQAGRVLGCSVRTVRRRIADGSLPAVLEHDRTMIRGDELRTYIDQLARPNGTVRRRSRAPRQYDYGFLRE